MKYDLAFQKALELKTVLAEGCARLEIVGSVRRNDREEVGDIEILCIADRKVPRPQLGQVLHKNMLEKAIASLQAHDLIGSAKLNGEKLKKFRIHGVDSIVPFYLELYIVQTSTWAIQMVLRTGPEGFSKKFVTNARYGGLLPDQYRYIRGETQIRLHSGELVPLVEEEDAIELLGLGYIAPEKRKEFI